MDVPADAVRPGENTLSVEVGRILQPDGVAREVGVLLRQLRVLRAE
jgi:hypothetical protein